MNGPSCQGCIERLPGMYSRPLLHEQGGPRFSNLRAMTYFKGLLESAAAVLGAPPPMLMIRGGGETKR